MKLVQREFQSSKILVETLEWAGALPQECSIAIARTTRNSLSASTHSILILYTDESTWRPFGSLWGSYTDIHRAWAWVSRMTVVSRGLATVALVQFSQSNQVSTTGFLPAVQLVLHPGLSPKCASCGNPIEHHPGRPGRPRRHCESCRPSTWPRRGETWMVDGQPMIVLGSRTRPDRSVRARPVDSGLPRWLKVGVEWKDARRLPTDAPELRSAS
mgnify:CR=1 FL=1